VEQGRAGQLDDRNWYLNQIDRLPKCARINRIDGLRAL
jgi:hypothetical protein